MNKNLVISHNTDIMQVEEAIAVARDIEDGFTYPTPSLSLKKAQYDKFIEDIKINVCSLKSYKYSQSKNSTYEKHQGDYVRIYTTGSSVDTLSEVYTTSEEISEKVFEIFMKYADRTEDVPIYMHSYFMNDGRLDCNISELKGKDLNSISEKYYPYIDTNVMFEQFFTGAENILLLVGAPGLGKSKLSTLALKHAYNNPDILPYDKMKEEPELDSQYITCCYVKSTDVLINDKFWREIEKQKADFCIIDDLDYMLTKREAEVQNSDDVHKNVFLNQFLSYTDGIEKHHTKFIITTNQGYDHIDAALLREGRLFDILEFRKLNSDEALNVWKDNALNEHDFYKVFTEDHVLPAKLGSEISKRLNTRIQSATKKYLLEENISKVKKASSGKKIKI